MIEFGSVTGIPGNTQSTVLSFTNTGIPMFLRQIGVEGDADAFWQVFINMNEVLDRRTTSVESSFNFDLFSEPILIGDIIDVKVTHFRSTLQNFSSEIIITDTPDENITIVIDVNFNVPLVGTINASDNFIGELRTTQNLVGSLTTEDNLIGLLSGSKNLTGTLSIERDLNGVLECV